MRRDVKLLRAEPVPGRACACKEPAADPPAAAFAGNVQARKLTGLLPASETPWFYGCKAHKLSRFIECACHGASRFKGVLKAFHQICIVRRIPLLYKRNVL